MPMTTLVIYFGLNERGFAFKKDGKIQINCFEKNTRLHTYFVRKIAEICCMFSATFHAEKI